MDKLYFNVESKIETNILSAHITELKLHENISRILFRLYCDCKQIKSIDLKEFDDVEHEVQFKLSEDGLYFVKVSIYIEGKKYERNSVTYEYFIKNNEQLKDVANEHFSSSISRKEKYSHFPYKKEFKDFLVIHHPLGANCIFGDLSCCDLSGYGLTNLYFFGKEKFDNCYFSGWMFHNKTIIEGNSFSVDSQLFDSYDAHTGNYTCVFSKEDHIFIQCDYFGLSKIYYFYDEVNSYFICSNRYLLLIQAISQLKIPSEIDYSKFVSQIYLTDITTAQPMANELLVSNTFLLPIYKIIKISSNGIQLQNNSFFDNYNCNLSCSSEEYDQLVSDAIKELDDNLLAIFDYCSDDTIICDISGGMDTRIVYALLVNHPELYKKVVFRSFGEESEKQCAYSLISDYKGRISRTISKYSREFKHLNPYSINDYLSLLLSGYAGVDFEVSGLFELPDCISDHYIRLSGDAGEIITRKYIQGHVFRDVFSDVDKTVDAYIKHNSGRTIFGYDSIGTIFSDSLKNVIFNSNYELHSQKYEDYFLEFRSRFHFDSSYSNSYFMRKYTPLLSKSSYKAFQVSLKQFSYRKYIFDLIYRINPEVARYEYLEQDNNNERTAWARDVNILIENKPKGYNEIEYDDSPVLLHFCPAGDWDEVEDYNDLIYSKLLVEYKELKAKSPNLLKNIDKAIVHFLMTYGKSTNISYKKNAIMLYKAFSSVNIINGILHPDD